MWVNYPHMPTGAKGSKILFQKLINFGKENDILICHDNPYSLILNDNPLSILSMPGAKDVSLELNSLSKSHNMAGWRIGCAVGNENNIRSIIQVKSNIDSGQFFPIQQAAIAALRNSTETLKKTNAEYQNRRILVNQFLDILDCNYTGGQVGLFVWAKVPKKHNNGESFSDWLLQNYRIFVTPGVVFGSNGDKYIRVSLCKNTQILKQIIKRLQ